MFKIWGYHSNYIITSILQSYLVAKKKVSCHFDVVTYGGNGQYTEERSNNHEIFVLFKFIKLHAIV